MEQEVRLIDANKLKNHYAWWENGTAEMTLAEAKKNFDVIIDVQPTVEAIPIDWILNHEKMPKSGKGHDAIMDMIESWGERREDAEKTD